MSTDHIAKFFGIFIAFIRVAIATSDCSRVFTISGSFEAPDRLSTSHGLVDQDKCQQTRNETILCIYKFIAKENERVALNFTSFQLRGDEPECNDEYVDVFINLKSEDELEQAIEQGTLNGRFCSSVIPHRFISLYNMIVLIIYSNRIHPDKSLIKGNFEFIGARSNAQIGPPEQDSICSHTILSKERREGEFQSVTYPGVYVKGLKCKYKFLGLPKQRVRVEFLDIDMPIGEPYCPIDSIKVFDGLEESDPMINTICGSNQSLIFFSRFENLLITFTTMQRESEIQHRGFSAYFEFSDKFVDPEFIVGPIAKYILGSECDQRIKSNRSSMGLVLSPEPKHHPNAICRYVFEGLQTTHDYEKIILKFKDFDLKTSTNSSTVNGTDQCNDNYVRIYTEQKPDQKQDPNDYDYVFCGNDLPSQIESDAASLLMEYNSGSTGGRFEAEYKFVVDFRIPGIQSGTDCEFTYKSDFMKSGLLNSPRHPSWYLNNIDCTYILWTKPNEFVLLQFNAFKMHNLFGEKFLGYNEPCKGEDLVEIHELSLEQSHNRSSQLNESRVLESFRIGTYCGFTTPGPILSYKPLRINFRANKESNHYGFSAIYSFHQLADMGTYEFVTNCGGQIFTSQARKSGSIASPETYRPETYEKRNHICSWNITARPSFKIFLEFNRFEIEGVPLIRGCITASIRIATGRSKPPTEICGRMNMTDESARRFLSEDEWLGITFISTKQASGSNGFEATWTEVRG